MVASTTAINGHCARVVMDQSAPQGGSFATYTKRLNVSYQSRGFHCADISGNTTVLSVARIWGQQVVPLKAHSPLAVVVAT